jgi:hypothetical protein
VKEQDVKSPIEVSIEWLKEVLGAEGYKIEPIKSEPERFIALHDEPPKTLLLVGLPEHHRFITAEMIWRLGKSSGKGKSTLREAVETMWGLSKSAWGAKPRLLEAAHKADYMRGRARLLEAVNKANSTRWTSAFFVPENPDTLAVSTFMYLSERVSRRDVVLFIELLTAEALVGLGEFSDFIT